MRVEQRAPWNLSPQELEQCRTLTFSFGLMKPTLRSALQHRQGRVFFIKNEKDKIIAWALVVPQLHVHPAWTPSTEITPIAMFFVQENCRRQGYGSQLLRIIRRRYVKVGTYAHNPQAMAFFGPENEKANKR